MSDIKKHIKIADAFGKDAKELDEGFVDWVTSTVQKVLGIDDAKADEIAGQLKGDMTAQEEKAADDATSNAETKSKSLTKTQKDAIAGRGEFKPTDQEGGVAQGTDAADKATDAADDLDAFGGPGPEVDTSKGDAGSNLAGKLDVKTANLMKAYNDGGKQAMPAIKDLQTALGRLGHNPNGIDGKYGQCYKISFRGKRL